MPTIPLRRFSPGEDQAIKDKIEDKQIHIYKET